MPANVRLGPTHEGPRRLIRLLRRNRGASEARLQFLSSLYATLSQISQLVVRVRTPSELFQETVRIFVEAGRFDLAWIGLPDGAGSRIRVTAAHGPSLAYAQGLEIDLTPVSPERHGPTGLAYRERRTVVAQDWATDPLIAPWRERAAPFGLRASASFPVFQAGQAVAVMTLYSKVPGFFEAERVELLEGLARDLSFALDKMAEATRRVEAEEAARVSDELFRAAFARAIAAKSIATPEGRLLKVNEAYGRMLGYEPGELEGATILDLTHPEDRAETTAFIANVLAGRTTAHRQAKRYLHKDGHTIWGDMNSVMVRDAHGEPLYFITDIVDITQRKALEAALKDLNEALEARVALRTRQLESANLDLQAFAFGASHDLQAPLRVLAGFVELLLEDGPALPEALRRDYLERIRGGATRMGRILDDLLRLARIGQEDFTPAAVDLAAITREVFGYLQEAEPERVVGLELPARLPARGDARLLHLLLGNLVGNAWKFTARQASPLIEVGQLPGEDQVFFVRDNGVGFAMARATRLFDPFQRLHHGRAFPGTGIGLALADRVVKRHGGRIWAQAEPGQGATFFFTLG